MSDPVEPRDEPRVELCGQDPGARWALEAAAERFAATQGSDFWRRRMILPAGMLERVVREVPWVQSSQRGWRQRDWVRGQEVVADLAGQSVYLHQRPRAVADLEDRLELTTPWGICTVVVAPARLDLVEAEVYRWMRAEHGVGVLSAEQAGVAARGVLLGVPRAGITV